MGLLGFEIATHHFHELLAAHESGCDELFGALERIGDARKQDDPWIEGRTLRATSEVSCPTAQMHGFRLGRSVEAALRGRECWADLLPDQRRSPNRRTRA